MTRYLHKFIWARGVIYPLVSGFPVARYLNTLAELSGREASCFKNTFVNIVWPLSVFPTFHHYCPVFTTVLTFNDCFHFWVFQSLLPTFFIFFATSVIFTTFYQFPTYVKCSPPFNLSPLFNTFEYFTPLLGRFHHFCQILQRLLHTLPLFANFLFLLGTFHDVTDFPQVLPIFTNLPIRNRAHFPAFSTCPPCPNYPHIENYVLPHIAYLCQLLHIWPLCHLWGRVDHGGCVPDGHVRLYALFYGNP